MATIAQAKAYLRRVKAAVERPEGFYREHYLAWRDLACRVAETTLLQLKPANIRHTDWKASVAASLETVGAALLDGPDYVGARMWMARTAAPSGARESYRAAIPFETIVEWVRAGRAGDPAGKRLREGPGEIDEGKNDRAIAWRVFHALRLGKSPGLQAAVRSFQEESGDAQVLLVFDRVQEAWDEFFLVQCGQDWARWLARVTAE